MHQNERRNYRHGDVILRRVDGIPDGTARHPDLTLAYGESTGHHHTVVEGLAAQYRDAMGAIYLEVLSDEARIDHPEHGLRTLDRGVYEIDIQQAWEEDGWESIHD